MANNINKRQGRRRTPTTTPITVSSVTEAEHHKAEGPEFIRLPKARERCTWTGLSRASLNELILGSGAPVKSVVLRQPGATRGIRLIHLDSLLTYLHAQMDSLTGEVAEGAALVNQSGGENSNEPQIKIKDNANKQ